LTTQLTVKDAQLAEKDRQIGTLQQQFADRSREVSELHVLLQNAQRLQAGASPDASQTRSVPSGDANGAQTTDHPGLLIAELSALNRQLVEERMARRQAEESLQRFDDEFLRKQAGIEARLTRLTNDSSELNDWWDRLGLINPETHKPSFLRALWLAPLLVPSQLRRIIPYFICSLLASVVIAALFTHYLPDTRLWTVIRLVIVIGLVGILSEVFFPTLRRRRQRQRGRGFLWFSPSEVYTIAGMYVAVIGVAAQQTPFGIWRFVCYGTMIFVGIASVCVASYIKQRAANGAVGMTEAPNVASIS
jgi:hypothetical protein